MIGFGLFLWYVLVALGMVFFWSPSDGFAPLLTFIGPWLVVRWFRYLMWRSVARKTGLQMATGGLLRYLLHLSMAGRVDGVFITVRETFRLSLWTTRRVQVLAHTDRSNRLVISSTLGNNILQGLALARPVRVGDHAFDASFSVWGDAVEVFARISAPVMRHLKTVKRSASLRLSGGRLSVLFNAHTTFGGTLERTVRALSGAARGMSVSPHYIERVYERVLGDGPSGYRTQALAVLRQRGGRDIATRAAKSLLQDPTPSMRVEGLLTLGELTGSVPLRAAMTMVDDGVSEPRLAELLTRMGRQSLPAMRQIAFRERAPFASRRIAFRFLGAHGTLLDVEPLRTGTADAKSSIKAEAAEAVRAIQARLGNDRPGGLSFSEVTEGSLTLAEGEGGGVSVVEVAAEEGH